MRPAYLLITLGGVGCFLSSVVSKLWPSLLLPIIAVLLFLALVFTIFLTLFLGVVCWRKSNRYWMGPAVFSVAICSGFLISGRLGVWTSLDDWRLKHNMASYATIVDSIHNGTVPCDPIEPGPRDRSDPGSSLNLPPHTIRMRARCCSDGSVVVLFLDAGSSFAGHTGYLYKDYPATSGCAADFAKWEHT